MSDPKTVPSSQLKFTTRLTQSRWVHSILRNHLLIFSGIIFLGLFTSSFLSPWIASQNPYDLASLEVLDSELPPTWQEGGQNKFLFGTDHQGRDLLSTILYGMRLSLIISICAVLLQSLIGVILGVISGYFGGSIDNFIMRLADIQLSLSTLMLAIISLAIVKSFFDIALYEKIVVYMIVIVIGLSEWPQYARTVRAGVLEEKKKEYVEAAEALGFSQKVIIFKHILPNILSPIFVIATIQFASAIISEASLSFLGLGIPPTQPSLGTLIHNGFEYIFSGSWWISILPSLFLIALILAINNIGDWLRDYLNPKLYKD